MQGYRYLKDATTLEFRESVCIGCGRCMEVCPHQVFSSKEKKAYIRDRDACMECGACALNCPVKAITVDSGVGCAAGLISEWLQERRLRAPGGSCCS